MSHSELTSSAKIILSHAFTFTKLIAIQKALNLS